MKLNKISLYTMLYEYVWSLQRNRHGVDNDIKQVNSYIIKFNM